MLKYRIFPDQFLHDLNPLKSRICFVLGNNGYPNELRNAIGECGDEYWIYETQTPLSPEVIQQIKDIEGAHTSGKPIEE